MVSSLTLTLEFEPVRLNERKKTEYMVPSPVQEAFSPGLRL